MKEFLDRLKEPSTWAGIAAALVALGVLSQSEADTLVASVGQIATGIGSIAGLVAVWRRERRG